MQNPTPRVDELYRHLKLKRWLKAEELPYDDVVQATDQHSAPFTSTNPKLLRDTPGDKLDSAKKTATCLSPSTTTYCMTTWSRIWLWSIDELANSGLELLNGLHWLWL